MGDDLENKEEARQWLAFAIEDLDYGRFGLTRFPRAAAWSFQQSSEKALKACLVANGRIPPRTHDLVLLHNLIEIPHDPKLEEAVLKLA
jgi:HEPN domain-containing protein